MPPRVRVVLLMLLLLLPLLLRSFRCATLPSGVRNDCSASEAFFGPCLPGTPRTCPGTCPPGCRCTMDSCCYPRTNPAPNPAQMPRPQANAENDSFNLVNLALLMLLFRQRTFGGNFGAYGIVSTAFGCHDAAWNCFQFAPMCAYSLRMLSFCPRTCGVCPSVGFGTALSSNNLQTQIALANALGNSAVGKK